MGFSGPVSYTHLDVYKRQDKYLHEVPLKNGADRFITYCANHDIRLGIATSNERSLVEGVLQSL